MFPTRLAWEGKDQEARSSSLIPSDPLKPVCCKSLIDSGLSLNGSHSEAHSETVVVGGDAVATRRFLGNNPPLAFAHAVAAPLSSLRDPIGAAIAQTLAGGAVADIPCLGADPWRVGDAVLESYS